MVYEVNLLEKFYIREPIEISFIIIFFNSFTSSGFGNELWIQAQIAVGGLFWDLGSDLGNSAPNYVIYL